MHTSNESLSSYLLHRIGYDIDPIKMPIVISNALESNKNINQILNTKGNNIINALVGFLDLKGFSSFAKGKNPNEIRDYIMPFLNDLVKIISNYALIDKTIGDEIMFILPFPNEVDCANGWGSLSDLFSDLSTYVDNSNYNFRIGMSFGSVLIDEIKNENYSEFVAFGEVIIYAKRIMEETTLKNPNPCLCAIVNYPNTEKYFDKVELAEACCSRFTKWKILDKNIISVVKGIGPIEATLIGIKSET